MTNEYNPDGKEIRFIDSHYKDLFHIPDGSCVQIHYPDEMVVKPCTFIDEYHTQIGYNVFHICQFAEIMERNGASYMPEPEIMGDEAAWKVGKDRILAVQTCEDGYDYTLLDENYNEIDGGQVDNPELSMLEVRRDILESFGLERRELRAMFYHPGAGRGLPPGPGVHQCGCASGRHSAAVLRRPDQRGAPASAGTAAAYWQLLRPAGSADPGSQRERRQGQHHGLAAGRGAAGGAPWIT